MSRQQLYDVRIVTYDERYLNYILKQIISVSRGDRKKSYIALGTNIVYNKPYKYI